MFLIGRGVRHFLLVQAAHQALHLLGAHGDTQKRGPFQDDAAGHGTKAALE